jgi:ATP-dependent helicase HrpB
MLVAAGERGWGRTAAEVAVLLSERGLGGIDADLEQRLRRWRTERGKRAEAARGLALRWQKLTPGAKFPAASAGDEIGACVALAFPDRVSRRRGASGQDWLSVGGRGFRLDGLSPLAKEEWLAVAEIQGAASGARILSAAPIAAVTMESLFADRVEMLRSMTFDPATGGVDARRERRLGAVRLGGGPDDRPDKDAVAAALMEGVRGHGLALLPWPEAASALRARMAFAADHGFDGAFGDEALLADLDLWLLPLLADKRRLGDVPAHGLIAALDARLGWDGRRALDRIAPAEFVSPAGSTHAIDYAAEGGPAVELRVQALFGLKAHPMIGDGRVPLVLRLTSPAGRPIQTTRDLPGFWSGSWTAVAKEMRGRYPRHPWPDDPAAADPTLRTKKASGR